MKILSKKPRRTFVSERLSQKELDWLASLGKKQEPKSLLGQVKVYFEESF